MATFSGSSGSVSFFGADGEWHDLGSATWERIEPAPYAEPQKGFNYSSLINKTFTIKGTFTPSPAFWGIIVGMQLQYGLRELHRNLGRYSRWPYTN